MALSGAGVGTSPSIKTTPDNYTALDDFLLASADAINKPDVRELLIKTYGDQGITGFLTLTGAVKNAGAADQVEYFEEQRRHTRISSAAGTAGVAHTGTNVSLGSTAMSQLQDYDVILDVTSGDRFLVRVVDSGTATLYALNTTGGGTITASADQALIGNMYPQGYDQPTKFRDPGVERRQNPFMIVKERFQVSGSQATNIGYINTGNGDYRWFMYGEQEARKRFLDKREMMMLFAGQIDNLVGTESATGLAGSEGYFTAVESRGNVWSGGLAEEGFASDIDLIIAQLDKQGAPAEYAMYVNRALDLQIDDKLARGLSTQVTAGLPGQFGAFNNSPDMAVQLGFKTFTRGGYTFHKHDWKLLNDPTLLASSKFQGAMVPMTKVADPRTGAKSYALEMNYKSTNGYDRELNHWVTGGAVLGYTNNGDNGKDVATFHYRSECNLITRAANQHLIFTS